MSRREENDNVVGAGWIAKALVVCLFLGGSAAGYLWQKRQVHELGQEIRRLEGDLDRLEKGNEVLRQRYSVLASPRELDRRVQEFGLDLRSPAPEQILRLTDKVGRREVSYASPYGLTAQGYGRSN